MREAHVQTFELKPKIIGEEDVAIVASALNWKCTLLLSHFIHTLMPCVAKRCYLKILMSNILICIYRI